MRAQPSQCFEKKNLENAYAFLQSLCPETKGGGIASFRQNLSLVQKAKLEDLAIVIHAMGSAIEAADGDASMLGDVKAKLTSFVSAGIKQHARGKGDGHFTSKSYASLCKRVAELGSKLGGESIVNHFRENLVNPALADTVKPHYGDTAAQNPRALLNQHAKYAVENMSQHAVEQFDGEKRSSPHVAIHALATALRLEAKVDRLLRELKADQGKDSPPTSKRNDAPPTDARRQGAAAGPEALGGPHGNALI